jgi:thiol:disulfide interchange protein/DsbC/DsbD-like thiol-disulfide interchange protein
MFAFEWREQPPSQRHHCPNDGLMVISLMTVIGRSLRLLLGLLALTVTGSVSAQMFEGRELVKAELLADTAAVVPGKPFTVGVLLRMVPHWHTYWKYSGDAGLPSKITWELPPEWKVGDIQWPIPMRLKDPGDIETYGYENEVMLMQEITPPASLKDPPKLAAKAEWLVCERLCVPGDAQLKLDLRVADNVDPANQETFSRYRSFLPQKWPDGNVATASWKGSSDGLQLTIESNALTNYPYADFFPLPPAELAIGHPQAERGAGKITFRIPIENRDPKLTALEGVVVFGPDAMGPNRNAWSLDNNVAVAAGASLPDASGILKFLFFGFLGGFILNLMPCVLPVISLKIFGFIQHAGQSRQRILRSGLAFILGIFVWFIGLAILLIILKSLGREITWAFQFTNPYFVVAMSAVVLVFALNLFGVFEVTLPQSANRGLLSWTAREGDAGSFFQGVFATVLATPCTAPFLAPALGFAFTQSGWLILVMFLAIAAGMSSPYLLLSAQPAWLHLLPKPGPWMERVKQLMGFLLLATLLFLLSVLGAERGVEAIIWTSCFLLALGLACWIKGAFVVPTASASSRAVALILALLVAVSSGFYFIGQKFAATKLASTDSESHGDWLSFTPDRLQTELDQGKAVFVDFTAAWCLTCKFNEATVLESSAVRDAFQRRGIVKFKADWTNADPAITKILKQFGRPGVPMYVLYPGGKSAEPILFPELLTESIILDKLETVTPHVASE